MVYQRVIFSETDKLLRAINYPSHATIHYYRYQRPFWELKPNGQYILNKTLTLKAALPVTDKYILAIGVC